MLHRTLGLEVEQYLECHGDARVAQEYEAFRKRDIRSKRFAYLWADGIHGGNTWVSNFTGDKIGVSGDGKLFIPRRDEDQVDVYTDAGLHLATLSHGSLEGPDGILAIGNFEYVPPLVPALSKRALVLLARVLCGDALALPKMTRRMAGA